MSEKTPKTSMNMGYCVALGLIIGAAISVLLQNWMYTGLGLLIGVVIQSIFEQRSKQSKS